MQRTDRKVIEEQREIEKRARHLRKELSRAGIRPKARIHSDAFERGARAPVKGRGA